MKRLKWKKQNLGITFVELLIVIGILVILITIAFPFFRYFQKESDLNNSVEEIINTLRLAQNKTISSEGASQYGVYFDNLLTPHRYILFKGTSFNLRDGSFDEILELPGNVEIYGINLDGVNEVVFNRLTGTTNQSGNISLRLKTDPSKNGTIYIENSGKIGLTPPLLPSDESRIKDSRHIHLDLGWGIRNATQLKFYFPAIPQTETVNMANYFNADKTEFNWEGKFSVAETDQVFLIHTHYFSDFNTSLCIHRDRNQGKNNQEVIIYIIDSGIDKDIIHYLADLNATAEKGFYVNTIEKQ